jgi:hypothetical protein
VTTHDLLSYAVAGYAVRQFRAQSPGWDGVFSAEVHVTASRLWPQPDFVVVDENSSLSLAAEFKPPRQTKREYLTGLGQAVAYTRDFSHAALIVPDRADDGYPIADHILDVLIQEAYDSAPIALWSYDPSVLTAEVGTISVSRPVIQRRDGTSPRPALADSFYAKWREASPMEIGLYLELLYEEGRSESEVPVRDRAFARLWARIVAGQTTFWAGGTRSVSDTPANRTAWGKNYRNFVSHLEWMNSDGRLTESGLDALHVATIYGATSAVFLDHITVATLTAGKHLVLINAIEKIQNDLDIIDEGSWLAALEQRLESEGLLKRNPERSAAATQQSPRGFLKAEKQLWRSLEVIVPAGPRVFHPGRGFIFDWDRITSLLAR